MALNPRDQRIYATKAYVDAQSGGGGAEVNDLTAAVTWANVPDANITQSSVTQHQAALTITESQISDLGSYLTSVVAANVNTEAATDGQVLTSDGLGNAAWESVAGGTVNVADLADTNITLAEINVLDVSLSEILAGEVLVGVGGSSVPNWRLLTEADISDLGTYLTGNETITLSGDVTGTGATAITTAIAANTIGTSELNATGTPSSATYLRGDMSWQTPPDTGITDVVQDTTPQLGGNLDCNTFNIQLDNNDYIEFRDTGGTLRLALGVDTGNDLRVGDSNFDDMYLMNPVLMTVQSTTHLGNSGYGGFQARGVGIAGVSYPQWADSSAEYMMGFAEYKLYANQSDTVDGGYINAAWYSDDASVYALTLEASTSTNFPVGGQITVWNDGASTLTITEGSGDTLYYLDGSSVTDTLGGCTIAAGGYATIIRKTAATWLIMGSGITP